MLSTYAIERWALITIVIILVAACDQSTRAISEDTGTLVAETEKAMLEITKAFGSAPVDISVPFERFSEAPKRLRQIADAINMNSSGLYVMHYYDDTLRHTTHVFIISETGSQYIALTETAGETSSRAEFEIKTATFDEQERRLALQTGSGVIYLGASDITPVGA